MGQGFAVPQGAGVGQGFAVPQEVGMGQENFLFHAGQSGNRARQNLAGRGQKPHPLNPPYPIAIPMHKAPTSTIWKFF